MPDAPPLSPVELLTLAVLSDRTLYGYLIAQEIEERSGGAVRVRPGNLYRVLDRLESRGWAEPAPAPADAAGEDERRQYYRATPEGRRVAARQLAMYAEVLSASEGLSRG